MLPWNPNLDGIGLLSTWSKPSMRDDEVKDLELPLLPTIEACLPGRTPGGTSRHHEESRRR